MMNIDAIIAKGKAGEPLNAAELSALMRHAIDLLRFIDAETQKSISCAHDILDMQYPKAA